MAKIIERGCKKKASPPQPGRQLVCDECNTTIELTARDKIYEAYEPFGRDIPYNYEVKCPLCPYRIGFRGLTVDHGIMLMTNDIRREYARAYDVTKLEKDHKSTSISVIVNWIVTLTAIIVAATEIF